ncbi:pyruvate dehydrogenase (acetyl-transferring) E1 component subunit alpha [Anaeromyxobacter diazotrophicus]|uniref:Pyruvate dehydrogenase E1 component subunit alpha n=1 Tax=Anaeromyxobacter diazotrophicus TaxID=2590199 RepID=A0A7I9VP18_9BACT|nr:pyruvate dehydrogenase (acetyl-transferring) E1 component subunit alpha [Anaeromyxobacter diazotrophicus]GEJ57859.1 pyruvate dehydrogenase E1 component subunit alpha [Anaeromyxobacter diazotrophicus]
MAEANTAAREAAAPRAETAPAAKQALLDLYRRMLLLRRFEEAAGRVYTEGKIGGFCHLYIGQEAVGIGVQTALDPARDYLVNGYRDHGHALAWGTEPEKVMAELYGKANGIARGKGGSMHMFDAPRHNLGGYGIVGGQIPLAVGVGFALRYQKKDGVVVCLFGEAAVNNGAFWESLNMAAIWKLPVIFICENNRYGMGTSIERSSAVTEVWRRACAHDLRGELVDGMDVLAVRDAVARAAAEVRPEGGKPVLLEARTYRYRGHSMADPATYRTRDEVEQEKKRDPLNVLLARARERSVELPQPELEQLDAEVGKVVEAALRAAEEGPQPDVASIWRDVYASAEDPALHREI